MCTAVSSAPTSGVTSAPTSTPQSQPIETGGVLASVSIFETAGSIASSTPSTSSFSIMA